LFIYLFAAMYKYTLLFLYVNRRKYIKIWLFSNENENPPNWQPLVGVVYSRLAAVTIGCRGSRGGMRIQRMPDNIVFLYHIIYIYILTKQPLSLSLSLSLYIAYKVHNIIRCERSYVLYVLYVRIMSMRMMYVLLGECTVHPFPRRLCNKTDDIIRLIV